MSYTAAQVNAWLMGNMTMMEAKMEQKFAETHRDMDIAWLVLSGSIVFFMQAGFSMLEAGAVGRKNVINILYKNIMDASIGAICFWMIGYGFAFGKTAGGFIGTDGFALSKIYNNAGAADIASDGWEGFFFQWAFAGTAATIVSGSVAERTKFEAYLIYSALCTIWIYPVVVHWGWGNGWLSAWGANPDDAGNARPILKGDDRSNGMIDFAGSGVVHMVGGVSGLMGAILVGPRLNRFDSEGKPTSMPGHNTTMMALGTTILWFGWYGFNCGSTLMISGGAAQVAGKVAVTTTIAAASGCLTATVIARIFEKTFDIGVALNGILGALVGITAGCSVVNPWAAFIIGIVAACTYYGAHCLLLKLRIDDPLDAFPIHGCCGAWAVISTGIFCTDAGVQYAAYPNVNDACSSGEQFGVQIIGVLAIATWAAIMSGGAFFLIKISMGLRVEEHIESEGLDASEHGGHAYGEMFTDNAVVGGKNNQVMPLVVGNGNGSETANNIGFN